ncbi:hypothetical protein AJ79_07546 [Helicocarpus griseus UAMH5409]|uniref:Uncharacterized protein n=1 Tax=Helicocarpus griseus UAMH5409 TaxID=1447875 RepID=A0A2B7X1W9_9EURO|nr:hypothetical protein AJ79_07546 [Helicocarpus griseus UAMH5409]
MSSSRRPDTSRFLGESWASWSPEDADQSTCIDSDDEVFAGMDFPSSIPSTGPEDSQLVEGSPMQQFHPAQGAQDGPAVSVAGPELIMPSIHEEFTTDGSWVVSRPSAETANSLTSRALQSANPPSRVPPPSARSDEKRGGFALPKKSRFSRITDDLGHRSFTAKSILTGILLLVLAWSIKTVLPPWMTQVSIFPISPGRDMLNPTELPAHYQALLDARTRFGRILSASSVSASELPNLLKRSESSIVDLCDLWTEDMGSKHEVEFECDNAFVAIRQAREGASFLSRGSGSVALDEVDREMSRMKRSFTTSSRNEVEGLVGRILNLFSLHSRQPRQQFSSEAQYRRAETALDIAVSKQLKQVSYILEMLNSFQSRLKSISEIASRLEIEPEFTSCWSHRPDDRKDVSFASLFRNLRCTLEETLLRPFNSGAQGSAYHVSRDLKSGIQTKLARAEEHQRPAVTVANALASQLKGLQTHLKRAV